MKLNITIEIDDAEIARLFGPRPPATEPGSTFLIEVGGVYQNRAGDRVVIERYDSRDYTYVDCHGFWYESDGGLVGDGEPSDHDLVSRVS